MPIRPTKGKLTARVGQRTEKGTLVTQKTRDAADADYSENLIIYENNVKAIEEAIDKSILIALDQIGQRAERYAKLACPVDTGRLRNSITHEIDSDDDSVYIGTNVEYAPYVENDTNVGGKHRAGVHMIRNAASQHMDEYENVMKKQLDYETI